MKLHWEHGYRTHGYWPDDDPLTRVGAVTLPPLHVTLHGYGWEVTVPGFPTVSGRLPDLRSAKKQVAMLVADMLALMEPGEFEREAKAKRLAWK